MQECEGSEEYAEGTQGRDMQGARGVWVSFYGVSRIAMGFNAILTVAAAVPAAKRVRGLRRANMESERNLRSQRAFCGAKRWPARKIRSQRVGLTIAVLTSDSWHASILYTGISIS